jgi:hypothetical protein
MTTGTITKKPAMDSHGRAIYRNDIVACQHLRYLVVHKFLYGYVLIRRINPNNSLGSSYLVLETDVTWTGESVEWLMKKTKKNHSR